MDPNSNLKEQAELIGRDMSNQDKRRLSELRRALNAWLIGGGFAPDWKAYPAATETFRKWRRQFAKFQDLMR